MGIKPGRRVAENGPGADGNGAGPGGEAPQPARPRAASKTKAAMATGVAGARAGRAADRSTPAALEIAEEANKLLEEANANTQALVDTIDAIIRADTIDDIVRATLDTIRKEFGWSYASYWSVDPAENALVFSMESGRVDDEFQRVTRSARFREGEGLNGRSWRLRDLFHVADLGELHDCCRAPLARRAGIRTAVAPAAAARRRGRRHARLLLRPVDRGLRHPTRGLADDRPAVLGQALQAGPTGRVEPDQADGRQRADQHDVRRPRPEDPLHEPAGRADAQAAGGAPAGAGVADGRRLDRRVPQGARVPAPAAGRPAEPAAHRDDRRRARAVRADRLGDARRQRQVHRADDHLGGDHREGRDRAAGGGDGGRHPGGQPAPAGDRPRAGRPAT